MSIYISKEGFKTANQVKVLATRKHTKNYIINKNYQQGTELIPQRLNMDESQPF